MKISDKGLGLISMFEGHFTDLGDCSWVDEVIQRNVTVNLNQNQYDALASLVFSIGENAFKKSALLGSLNNGEYEKARKELENLDLSCYGIRDSTARAISRRRVAEAKHWNRSSV